MNKLFWIGTLLGIGFGIFKLFKKNDEQTNAPLPA